MSFLNQHIMNKMPTGIITLDDKGRITEHNPASERIFESPLAESPFLRELVRESDRISELLDRCIKNGEVFTRMEFHVPIGPDDDKRIGINLSPITTAQGRIEGAIGLLSDLTEIVELQNQIKLKENFAALGEMSAGIAHEFKNSLATILGYAQMSATEADINTIQSYAKEILKESRALSYLVTDFLNFARPVNATMYDVDMNELLENVIGDLRNARPGNYVVGFHPAAGEAIVLCDATLMRQTFLNLLINATEALDGGGNIGVSVELAPRDQVRIAIEDSGRGIPAHQLTKIFFPFFTTKSHGTGLGLALVQKFVLAQNGRIEVQSAEGKGTRFTVTLPRN